MYTDMVQVSCQNSFRKAVGPPPCALTEVKSTFKHLSVEITSHICGKVMHKSNSTTICRYHRGMIDCVVKRNKPCMKFPSP